VDLSCETKPISQLRIADWRQTCGGRPACSLPPSACGGRNVQNEPNFEAGRVERELRRAVQTNPISGPAGRDGATGASDEGEMCETNPISAVPRGAGIPSASLSGQALPVSLDHRQDADAVVPPDGGTTNPSETQRQLYQTNPIPGDAAWAGAWGTSSERAKQSQVGPGSTFQPGGMAPNKPNLGPSPGRPDPLGATNAKQTQFDHAGRRRGRRRAKTCETNPICTRAEESVGQAPPYKGAQLRQTNPISPAGTGPGGCGARGKCAK
jgi:hypothetical protein